MRFFAVLLCISSWIFGLDIVYEEIANGKTTMVRLKNGDGTTYAKAVMDAKEYAVFEDPFDKNFSYVLLPINYYTPPSNKKITLYYTDSDTHRTKEFFLRIEDGLYAKEELKVSPSKIDLSPVDQQRVRQEYQEAMQIYNTLTPESFVKSEFIVPLNSKITSDFGKARTYNNKLNSYHGGTDFRAPVGVGIVASNDGIVALAKERFYSGKTVIIDHGHGIFTQYFHLSTIDVKEGEKVAKLQQIGLSGDTGRVTGPHLHFGVRVHAEQVDPLHLITLLNTHLIQKEKQ